MELTEPDRQGSDVGSRELPLWATGLNRPGKFDGADGTRTRDPRRDRPSRSVALSHFRSSTYTTQVV